MTQGKWVPERLTEDMYATFLRAREYESSADYTWKALLAAAPSIPAERDAQRYRWLRDTLQSSVGGGDPNSPVGFYQIHGETLDAAIDAAIEREKEK